MSTAEALAVVREALLEASYAPTERGLAALALIEQRVGELERERDEWKRDWQIAHDHALKQQTRVAELEAALREIAGARTAMMPSEYSFEWCVDQARRALGGGE